MSFLRNYRSQGGTMVDDRSSTFSRISYDWRTYMNVGQNDNHDPRPSYLDFSDFSAKVRNNISDTDKYNNLPSGAPSLKRRKYSASMWGDGGGQSLQPSTFDIGGRQYLQPSTFEDGGRDYLLHSNSYGNVARYQTQSNTYGDCWRQHVQPKMYRDGGRCLPSSSLYGVFGPSAQHNSLSAPLRSTTEATTSISCKRDRSKLEDEKPVFMSRDEIERCSPSRKDGIDAQHETHLRYSYCAFIQNLGLRLDLATNNYWNSYGLVSPFFHSAVTCLP
ncbi:CYCT1-2 [Linum perenne]